MDAQQFIDGILDIDKRGLSVNEHGFIDSEKVPVEIFAAADKALITKQGNPNYPVIDALEVEAGIKVYAGEKDRFGWVTGVIETPKGRKVLAF